MDKYSAVIILRWGLAFTFFYAAIAGLLSPENWIGYMPGFLLSISPFSPRLLLAIFSFYEIILATLLFAGWKIKYASLFAAVTLATITVLNLGVFDVTFRDVGLAFATLALWELVRKEKDEV